MSIIPSYFLRSTLLILLGLLIYSQTFQSDFVFDDAMFILNNPDITDFKYVSLIWHVFPLTRSIGFYSFALNYYFNQLAPQGYHIFNFIVHLIAVGLVWALADVLIKITKWLPQCPFRREIPFIVAVLFLVHPCQTQAVSYISQRFESMATVFYLGTVYCYLRARISINEMHKIILFVLSGLLAILGILTKEVAITVPAMILASEWILFPGKNNKRFYIVLSVGGILLFWAFSRMLHTGLSIFFQTTISQSHDGDVLTPAGYFLTQLRVFLTFLRLLVVPIHQNVDYDYPASTSLIHPPLTLLGLCVIGFIIFLVIRLRHRAPLIAWGLAWVLITFSINLAPRANVIFEHKLYLISFGFFLSTVSLLPLLIPDRRKFILAVLCVITALSFATFQRNKVWKNPVTLWNDTILKSPHKVRPYVNRGYILYHQGHVEQAIADYNKAVELDPDLAAAYNNLGWAYYNLGDLNKAFLYYSKAIEKDPRLAKAYYNRAIVYCKQGKYRQAILDFSRGIDIDPVHTDSFYNRGLAYYTEGNFDEALADYNKALEIDPNDADVYNNRGLAYYNQDKMPQALADYNKAIEKDPHLSKAYNNRALVYRSQGQYAQAISDFNKAISLDPDNAENYHHRGVTYYKLGNLNQALADFNKAIALGLAHADLFYNRGLVWDRQGYFTQALVDYSKAIEMNPRFADAYNNRAVIYYQLNRYENAFADMHKAQELGYPVNPGFFRALNGVFSPNKLPKRS